MSGSSAGQIELDLVVNQNQFQRQMSGIQGLAKKAGAALAAAFAVKKIVDFGAQCIELGSRLNEVQNVVDVTFPHMNQRVNEFAKNAKTQFGIGEIAAKRFTGTFGAMAKAFGFSEQTAYEMSTTLTGLAGDVASFYDTSIEEAYTKLKAVFSGETEVLKDLGIVMTQNALDSYALSNGYGKVTAQMTEAEKVALRYKFVQDRLSLASGDFARTSDSWANQVRVLTENFNDLKSAIGQGLINVLTPVIKVINTIIGKLMSLANAFKSFTEMITGKKGSGGGASAAAEGMAAVADAADNAGAAASGAGGDAKKAAKDMKSVTTGIDELNIIQDTDSSGGSGAGGGGTGGYDVDQFDMGEANTAAMDEMDRKYQGLIDKAKELKDTFTGGFKIGFGDTKVLDDIHASIQGIKNSFIEIFTANEVQQALNRFLSLFTYNLGKTAGSVASIGASIAANFYGGIDKYLKQNAERIKGYIVSMFDLGSKTSVIMGQFSQAMAIIFEAFRSEDAQQITADIIGIFSSIFMGITELGFQFGVDFLDMLTAPFIQNKDLIKTTLEDTFSAVAPIFSEIKSIIDELFKKAKATYDSSIAPMIRSFRDGFTEIAKKFLELYNTYFLPVLANLSDKFQDFRETYLSPLIDKFMEFVSKVSEAITAIWENALKPFVLWFMEVMAPVISENINQIVNVFWEFLGTISEILEDVLDALGGLMDFITGVFTGDWEKAWNGIKRFFEKICGAIEKKQQDFMDLLKNVLDSSMAIIKERWDSYWSKIKEFYSDIWDKIKEKASTFIEEIRAKIEEKITAIKDKWDEIWNGIKEKTSEVWEGIKGIVKGVIDAIVTGVEGMVNSVVKAINWLIDQINKISIEVPDTPFSDGFTMGFDIKNLDEVQLPRVSWLAQGGFVKANTPQLAMIGDNRHYGEIVAPEDKMQEMVDRAVAMAAGNNSMSDQYLSVMIDLLRHIIETIKNLNLTVNIDIREIKQKLVDLERRSGYMLRPT